MIQLYIGDGKGKTTSAIGQAIRALGWNKKVLFSQFLKSGETGEKKTLERMQGLTYARPELRHKGFIWNMDDDQLRETKEDILHGFFDIGKAISQTGFEMAVLDEVLDIVECGFITEEQLISQLNGSPDTEFILTGRRASEKLMELAGYVTVLQKMKHPFDKGITARKGIEY